MVHILLFILALAVLFTAAPSGLVNKMNAQPLATWADSVIDGPISTWRIDDAQQEYGKTQNAHTQSNAKPSQVANKKATSLRLSRTPWSVSRN
jgi:hypothetical protein